MSTRSCIARKGGEGWRGVYHHSDGYPSGLGSYIFDHIRRNGGDIDAFLHWAIDEHDGGWSHIFPASVLRKKGKGTYYDDTSPQPQCYCHGYFARRDGIRPGMGRGIITGCECGDKRYLTSKSKEAPSCNPLMIEWVYILDTESRTMTILESYGEDIPNTFAFTIVHEDGTEEQRPTRIYRHRTKAVVNLDGPEPNWREMEGR